MPVEQQLAHEDAGDEEAGDDEEDVDAEEAVGQRQARVVDHDEQDGDGAQALDVGPEAVPAGTGVRAAQVSAPAGGSRRASRTRSRTSPVTSPP